MNSCSTSSPPPSSSAGMPTPRRGSASTTTTAGNNSAENNSLLHLLQRPYQQAITSQQHRQQQHSSHHISRAQALLSSTPLRPSLLNGNMSMGSTTTRDCMMFDRRHQMIGIISDVLEITNRDHHAASQTAQHGDATTRGGRRMRGASTTRTTVTITHARKRDHGDAKDKNSKPKQ
eukprot:CAMPEP_0119546504 /NCGR_PEP_ID=MMETSP1352-20130426/900_1 /TAXON_ID=265584 /ORGANISM="Stauroneis constricta, Strain CCMP1120" /LENGTH=175 /DNA_ID=CAMNT_0007591215 /DNA_START=97 /DNA_END=624 /DNA_ORIENTATION=-